MTPNEIRIVNLKLDVKTVRIIGTIIAGKSAT